MIDATACLVDNGLFTELAVRLAPHFQKMRIWNAWEDEFPLINDRSIGIGLEGLEKVEDFMDPEVVDSTDLYIFPDIFRSGHQLILERMGKRVWGSRRADALETKRIWFRKLQADLELPVPPHTVIEGFKALCEFLKDHGHCFVKTTSKIRGTMETWEHFDIEQSEYYLDDLATRLGGRKEDVTFIVEEPIETEVETGFDTYSIDGQFPETPIQGIEVKGKGILCSAQTKSPTPKHIDEAMSALSPMLEQLRCRNFISAEFRQKYLSDPCMRCPNPGIGCEMEMISNLPKIIWEGANGVLVEPDFEFEFGIQAAIYHDHHGELWKQFRIPDEVRRWVKLMEVCQVDERYQIIPRMPHSQKQKIGWLVGVGNTIQEAVDHIQKNNEFMEGSPLHCELDVVEEAVRQATILEEQGTEFTDQKIPEAEKVL